MSEKIWLRGRKWRHGFRVDGAFIKDHYGKSHLFFQSRKEADQFFEEETKQALVRDGLLPETQDETKKRTTQ